MKKVTFFAAIFILALTTKSFSQKEDGGDYKPFKVDVSLGYAIPTGGGTGAKGGVLFAVEPKYSVTNEITVGLRAEAAVTVSGITSTGEFGSDGTASAKAAASYLLTGDYYFMPPGGFRAFGGLGAGIFQTASATVTEDGSGDGSSQGSKFGGMVRAGLEYKHFRFGVEYNLIGKTSVDASGSTPAYSVKNGYLGVKFGVLIGGGAR